MSIAMTEDDRPKGSGDGDGLALSDEQGEARLEDLLSPDDLEEPVEQEGEDDQNNERVEEPTEDENASEDESEQQEVDAESVELSDDMEIDLGDGNRVSFSQLRDSYLKGEDRIKGFQREHTAKFEKLAEDRRSVESKANEIYSYGQQIQKQREDLIALANMVLPEEPQIPQLSRYEDPTAWDEYSESKARYDDKMSRLSGALGHIHAENNQRQEQQQQQYQQWAAQERQKLLEKRPELRDRGTYEKTNAELTRVFDEVYGIPPQELRQLTDSRHLEVALDALKWRQLQSGKTQAKAKLAGKPKVMRSSKVATTKERSRSEQVERANRLRKTGSDEDAIARLMDFDL